MALSTRQKKFVRAYAACGNGAEAARQAGYAKRTARIMASKLLSKSNIQEAIAELQGKTTAELDLSRDSNLKRLKAIVDTRLSDIAPWRDDGWARIKSSDDLTEEQKRAVKKVRVRRYYDKNGGETIETEFELHDPLAALNLITKMCGQQVGETHEETERLKMILNFAGKPRDGE